ncbi:MAG: methenyltetrahydromethanopterin cyclohydrolase [Proteobacteria bacterium]|nr:MAG: methenyltetrahydromethanopterin cyclohydrolase [Pseudomonadota bacterium]
MNDVRADVSVHSQPLVEALRSGAEKYRVKVTTMPSGVNIIDAGIEARGGLEAGRCIAEICLGGLGRVTLSAAATFKRWPWQVNVTTTDPVVACLASQYAGWSLSHGHGKDAFHALASGPARAIGSHEALFDELHYRTPPGPTALVLEVDRHPPSAIIEKIVTQCHLEPSQLTLILTPTTSLAGGVQVVSRVLEVALHKVHELKFPLSQIVDGTGSAPVPPPSADYITAMGRTNDSILFGGRVHLYVDCDDDAARSLAERLPSSASRDFGRPFGTIFTEYGHDFYKIDPMLFSPATCMVTAIASGHTFYAGEYREDLLEASFNLETSDPEAEN